VNTSSNDWGQFYAAKPAKRAAIIEGLRQMTDWLEAHPDVPVDLLHEIHVHTSDVDDDTGYAAVARVAASMDVPVMRGESDWHASREFSGGVRFTVIHIDQRRMAEHEALTSYRGSVEPSGSDSAS
jgi:hypothetical protein